jgi:hypothetical protein
MDRLGYCLGDCSGAPVLASTSFGVTKVVRELPHFKRKLIWPFLASVMRPQAAARHDRIRQHTPFEIACQCGREGFRAGDSLLEGIARDTMNTCWGDLLGWRNPSGAGDVGARKSSVPRLTTFPLTCLASLRGTSSSSSPIRSMARSPPARARRTRQMVPAEKFRFIAACTIHPCV